MDEKKVAVEAEQSKRPSDSKFKQQQLPAWQPLLTPNWVIGAFVAIFAVFLPIGVVLVVYSNRVVELSYRYDGMCGSKASCNITANLTVTDDMKSPVYFYYELTNFYQNHRRYVKSRSDPQLRGSLDSSISTCSPLESSGGKTLVPCGLIANSFFNDSYVATMCRSGSCNVLSGTSWQSKGIAWSTDVNDKFSYTPLDPARQTNVADDGHVLPRVDNEEFIVWMRTAGLPTFKKLHRIINQDFVAGDKLYISIKDNYPVRNFDGQKRIVLSTTSFLGGKNTFLGWAYIGVAIASFVAAAAFLIKHKFSPRRLGDMQYFHWSIPPSVGMNDEE